MVLRNLGSYMQKNEIGLLSYIINKQTKQTNENCIKDLNVRPETIKLLETICSFA